MSEIRRLLPADPEDYSRIVHRAYPSLGRGSAEAVSRYAEKLEKRADDDDRLTYHGLFGKGKMCGGLMLNDFRMSCRGSVVPALGLYRRLMQTTNGMIDRRSREVLDPLRKGDIRLAAYVEDGEVRGCATLRFGRPERRKAPRKRLTTGKDNHADRCVLFDGGRFGYARRAC